MRKCLNKPSHPKTKLQEGQALVEYLLMLMVIIGIVTGIAATFQSSLKIMWKTLGREVIAACPSCPPNKP